VKSRESHIWIADSTEIAPSMSPFALSLCFYSPLRRGVYRCLKFVSIIYWYDFKVEGAEAENWHVYWCCGTQHPLMG